MGGGWNISSKVYPITDKSDIYNSKYELAVAYEGTDTELSQGNGKIYPGFCIKVYDTLYTDEYIDVNNFNKVALILDNGKCRISNSLILTTDNTQSAYPIFGLKIKKNPGKKINAHLKFRLIKEPTAINRYLSIHFDYISLKNVRYDMLNSLFHDYAKKDNDVGNIIEFHITMQADCDSGKVITYLNNEVLEQGILPFTWLDEWTNGYYKNTYTMQIRLSTYGFALELSDLVVYDGEFAGTLGVRQFKTTNNTNDQTINSLNHKLINYHEYNDKRIMLETSKEIDKDIKLSIVPDDFLKIKELADANKLKYIGYESFFDVAKSKLSKLAITSGLDTVSDTKLYQMVTDLRINMGSLRGPAKYAKALITRLNITGETNVSNGTITNNDLLKVTNPVIATIHKDIIDTSNNDNPLMTMSKF